MFTGVVSAQDTMYLGEFQVKAEIREPSVTIITSRITPEFKLIKVGKSFMNEIKFPNSRITDLNREVRFAVKMEQIQTLKDRDRGGKRFHVRPKLKGRP